MKLQRQRNGIFFTIDFPVEELIKEIEDNREHWKEVYCEKVNCFEQEATKSEQEAEINKMIEVIKKCVSDEENITDLFNLLPLKKNNKLSKTVKPVLHCLDIGTYIDECYGWRTQNIRLQVLDELNATVILKDTIIHY